MIFNYIHLVFNIINILMHAFVIYLLINIERKGVQQIYLLNLSVSEILKNFVMLLMHLPNVKSGTIFDGNYIHLRIIYDYGLMTSFYLTLIYIAMDVYFDMKFGKKYVDFWTIKKSKLLALGTWLVSIVLTIMISALCIVTVDYIAVHYFIYYKRTITPFVTYTNPGIDIVFIALFVTTAYKMIMKFVQTKKSTRSRLTIWEHFCKSTYVLPGSICILFVVFTVGPDFVFTYFKYKSKKLPTMIDMVCCGAYLLNDFSHAAIYVYIRKPNRELLLRCIHENVAFAQRFKKDRKRRYNGDVRAPFIPGGGGGGGGAATTADHKRNSRSHSSNNRPLRDMYNVDLSDKREHRSSKESEPKSSLEHQNHRESVNRMPSNKRSIEEERQIRRVSRERKEESFLRTDSTVSNQESRTATNHQDLRFPNNQDITQRRDTAMKNTSTEMENFLGSSTTHDPRISSSYNTQDSNPITQTPNARRNGVSKKTSNDMTAAGDRPRSSSTRSKSRRYGESYEVEKDKSMRKIGTYDMFANGRMGGTGTVLTSII